MCKSTWVLLVFIIGAYPGLGTTQTTVVQQHGNLTVQGSRIVGIHGNPVQLRGMSLYWSQWQGQFYNQGAVQWLRDDWKCTVVRAAMAVESGGYLTNPQTEKNKVIAVVEAAIALGIYVIIDWHDHNAQNHVSEAQAFFSEMAQSYGQYPNVLYELFNEPILDTDNNGWSNVIKPYHEAVIPVIRQHDPDNLIICGTRRWSQEVVEASQDPLDQFTNIAYTLHFYAGTHTQSLRDKAVTAMSNGLALFVTEWGTSEATGDGNFATTETQVWWDFMDQNYLSWTNWSVATVNETSAALNNGASGQGGWSANNLSPSGTFVRAELIAKYQEPLSIYGHHRGFRIHPFDFSFLEKTFRFYSRSRELKILKVFDINGAVVLPSKGTGWDEESNRGRSVSPGIYFIEVRGDAGTEAFKFNIAQ